MIPRIQGRVGQADDGKGKDSKWYFEIYLSELGKPSDMPPIGPFGPYDTEAKAKAELRNACRMACETIETRIDGEPSGKFIDMKTNETRNWDEN